MASISKFNNTVPQCNSQELFTKKRTFFREYIIKRKIELHLVFLFGMSDLAILARKGRNKA